MVNPLGMTPRVCNYNISVFPLHYSYVCYKRDVIIRV